ncbi:MAG: protein phosphatase 2C domain-containing protein [Sandaracinaceae bacterium]|nr:protein phosphatase 2C domain-containing protein [Sandaracinaceae bacterium]
MHIEHAARTHVGRRPNNEDSLLEDPLHGIFAVADGMGGYEGGEIASKMVVETLERFFVRNDEDAELTWPFGADADLTLRENALAVSLKLANREVHARRRGHLAQMGSTVVALAVDGPRVALAHVGDSRIYRLREGAIERLTRDHSLVEEMRERGMHGTPEGIGHIVTRAIGASPDTEPELRRELAREGDTFLLCSDGVTDVLDDEAIAGLLSLSTAERACEAIVEAAYEAGGSDNITAIVIRLRPDRPSPRSGPAPSGPPRLGRGGARAA